MHTISTAPVVGALTDGTLMLELAQLQVQAETLRDCLDDIEILRRTLEARRDAVQARQAEIRNRLDGPSCETPRVIR